MPSTLVLWMESQKRKNLCMHRFILNISDESIQIDHVNGNTLDNRKINLRIANSSENASNKMRLSPQNSSGYRGVVWDKETGKWMAQIYKDNKRKFLGRFDNKQEAAKAFDEAAKTMYGKFHGKLNFE